MKTIIDNSIGSKLNSKEILRYGNLFRYLSLRDVQVRYKQTWAGIAWAVIRPLVNIIIFGFLSILISKTEDYTSRFLSVSCGIILWQLISTSITETSNSLLNNSNILTKVYFPKIILPASSLFVCLIDFIISFVMFFIAFIVIKGFPGPQVFLAPLYIILALLFCFSLGIFFATLNVKYRDVKFILPFLLQIVFYASPVFISTSDFLKYNLPQFLKIIYQINPLVLIMDGFRYCFFNTEQVVEPLYSIISLVIVGLTLITGIRYFLKFEKTFADHI